MHHNEMRPAAGQSGTGLGISISSPAIYPEYSNSLEIVQRLQRRFAITELHAATVVRLAGLGPQEARS